MLCAKLSSGMGCGSRLGWLRGHGSEAALVLQTRVVEPEQLRTEPSFCNRDLAATLVHGLRAFALLALVTTPCGSPSLCARHPGGGSGPPQGSRVPQTSTSTLLPFRRDNPCIMDYIRLKHDVSELEKHVTDWKRKIEILNMERQRTRQVLKSVATVITGPTGGPSAMGSAAITPLRKHAK